MGDEEWLRVIDTDLNGIFRMLRAGLRHMIANRSGALVNLSSVLGGRAQAARIRTVNLSEGDARSAQASSRSRSRHRRRW